MQDCYATRVVKHKGPSMIARSYNMCSGCLKPLGMLFIYRILLACFSTSVDGHVEGTGQASESATRKFPY
jgi:hypothetical protein